MPVPAESTSAARQKEIFLAALELADPAERTQFLDTACGGEAALRGRIERLLRLEEESRNFLEPPPPAEAAPDFPHALPGQAVGYFGDYILLDEIARGSSGVVFRARQSSLSRIVALKMLRDRPLLTTEAETKRFHAEAEAAASLDHANIVPIYEVGAHEGQAYFSMKLVEGGTLQCRAAEFADPGKAAALMATAARAVQYAHGRGLLHRDLKPGNVLLDAAGEPHIADFGLAKKYGMDSSLTVSGQIMGTPHYMAPEQARGENRDLTPAADVYSLGAMLYELLGGRKPFAADDLVGLLKQVTDTAPQPLRSLVPSLDRDLETVVMRCLEKSPADRYASAAEFADDLDRWQRGEPVKARPAGVARRLLKWTKRRPVHAALAGLAALFVLTTAAQLWPRPEMVVEAPLLEPAPERDSPAASRWAAQWLRSLPNNPDISFLSLDVPTGPVSPLRQPNRTNRWPEPWEMLRHSQRLPEGDWHLTGVWLDRFSERMDFPPDNQAEFVRHMSVLARLRTVWVRQFAFDDAAYAFLAANPALEAVTIENGRVSDGIFPHLADLTGLRELRVKCGPDWPVKITGHGLETLASLPVLEDVNFAGSLVNDTTVLPLLRCPRLRQLDLSFTAITDAGVQALSAHPALQSLNLSGCAITGTSMSALTGMTSLNYIDINYCRPFDAEAVAAFRRTRPDCTVIWDAPE